MHRIRSWARREGHGPSPLSESRRAVSNAAGSPLNEGNGNGSGNGVVTGRAPSGSKLHGDAAIDTPSGLSEKTPSDIMDKISETPLQSTSHLSTEQGISETTGKSDTPKKNIALRFVYTTKDILFSSWINVLLIFVPIGIAAKTAHLSATLVFTMNAIAIIPLAGLLSHATESVAKRMGDTVGALMNVTFGNAVELIIFIALTKDEIRIVQASLLGSILANLLLILGMAFFLGGLRYREQVYNSTVTQMSACLLSLSVMSLLLPTAFHASFSDTTRADTAVLKVSRGTSVILLLVYGLYLLFQLRSHAYMYESTPQHIIDEISVPGPAAGWMDSSSSSSSSDSDDSTDSNTTARRIKRVLRHKRRKSSSSESESDDETTSVKKANTAEIAKSRTTKLDVDSALDEELKPEGASIEDESNLPNSILKKTSRKDRTKHKRKHHHRRERTQREAANASDDFPKGSSADTNPKGKQPEDTNTPNRVDFALSPMLESQPLEGQPPKRPFGLRNMSIRPALPKVLSQNVFMQTDTPTTPAGYGTRKTRSLPLDFDAAPNSGPSLQSRPSFGVSDPNAQAVAKQVEEEPEEENISRTTAVILLLASTGLVAICADFMVDAIDAVTTGTGLSATFVGLIVLPIVGNAAEHVTAVTVAMKNKVDLAIGVAVGSSIQIALFVTPFTVLLGWCMSKDMTLYFTLFETVSLFVSAFIVNFLVLDGRSNYLEGALLIAAYVIIAVAAFFYPEEEFQSVIGGNPDAGIAAGAKMVRGLLGV